MERSGHRLYLDENAFGVRPFLNPAHRVRTARSERLLGPGATDPKQLARAAELESTLITFDWDCFTIAEEAWRLAGRRHHGILASYHPGSSRHRSFAAALNALLESWSPAQFVDQFLIWDPIADRWEQIVDSRP